MDRLAHLVQKVADAAIDAYNDQAIRVGILEGIAGVHPGTWGSKGTVGIHLAQRALPDFPVEWFDRNTGTYRALYVVALRKLKKKDYAEDLVQQVIGGMTLTTPGGELYSVGKVLAKEGSRDLGHAKAMLLRHIGQRSMSENRGEGWESSMVREDEDGGVSEMDVASTPDREDLIDAILWTVSSPEGINVYQSVRKFLQRKWPSAPSKMVIFDKIIENPNASDVQVARDLGHGENDPEPWIARGAATRISLIRREIRDLMPEFGRQHPEIFKQIDMKEALSNLGFGKAWKFANLRQVIASFLAKK